MPNFVDLQGFKHEKDFILKEFALLNSTEQEHIIAQPPFEFHWLSSADQGQARWLERNYHGFSWDEGTLPYGEALATMVSCLKKKEGEDIYVKGLQKKIWLQKFDIFPLNIEDIGCDMKVCNLRSGWHCWLHYGVCAMRNVFHMKNWFNQEIVNVYCKEKSTINTNEI